MKIENVNNIVNTVYLILISIILTGLILLASRISKLWELVK